MVGLTVAGAPAFALLDPGEADGPFSLVRVSGARAARVAVVGAPGSEFPMLAARGSRVATAWDQPISGGVVYLAQARRAAAPVALHTGTGPGRLALTSDGAAVVAHPDTTGDLAVTTTPGVAGRAAAGAAPSTVRLSADAPRRRHFAAGLALRGDEPLVLDLVQQRHRSELRVVGEGAPAAPVTGVGALRVLEGALAATRDRIAVAYVSRGRPVLATAAPGGAWRRRTLSGSGVDGAPAVALAGGTALVAWSQPGLGGRRDVRLAVAGPGGRIRTRWLTRTTSDERPPLLASGPTGRVVAAWSSAERTARVSWFVRVR